MGAIDMTVGTLSEFVTGLDWRPAGGFESLPRPAGRSPQTIGSWRTDDPADVEVLLRPTARRIEVHGGAVSLFWLPPAIGELERLLALPDNWDSYGARAVTASAVAAGLSLLGGFMAQGVPLPAFVPTPRGGIQLEWHCGGLDVEVEADTDGRPALFVAEAGGVVMLDESPASAASLRRAAVLVRERVAR